MAIKKSIEKYKSFEKWRTQEIEQEFGLVRNFNNPSYLHELLQNLPSVTSEETVALQFLQGKLLKMSEAWNEYDMSIAFIGPLLNIIDFQHRGYRTFFNYTLKTIINSKELGGRIDCMLAKGWQIPESPLFFIQEFKPERGPNGDP